MSFYNWLVLNYSSELYDPDRSRDFVLIADIVRKDKRFPKKVESWREIYTYLKSRSAGEYYTNKFKKAFDEYEQEYSLVSIDKVEFLKNDNLDLLKKDVNDFLSDKLKRLINTSFSCNPVSQRYIVMIAYSEKQRQKAENEEN